MDTSTQQPSSQQPLSPELEQALKERDEYLEGWKRAKADFINYKNEETSRLDRIMKLSNEQLMRNCITVLDSFDLAIASLEEHSAVEKGIYLIRTQLEDVLKKYGLERVSVQPGDEFDPTRHEAIAVMESDKPQGTIVDEVEKGYMLAGKLVRPARVRVARWCGA